MARTKNAKAAARAKAIQMIDKLIDDTLLMAGQFRWQARMIASWTDEAILAGRDEVSMRAREVQGWIMTQILDGESNELLAARDEAFAAAGHLLGVIEARVAMVRKNAKPVVDAVKAKKIRLQPVQHIVASKPARRKKTVLILLPEEKFAKLDKDIRDPDELMAAIKALRH